VCALGYQWYDAMSYECMWDCLGQKRCGEDVGTSLFRGAPGEPQDLTQTGSWTIVSGTGAFEGLRGSGEMEVVNDPDDDSLAHETLTGTVTH
jgi:hypothetical protein